MDGASGDLPVIVLLAVLGFVVLGSIAVAALVAVPLLRRVLHQKDDNAKLVAEGVTAKATVISAQQTGVSVEQGGFESFEVGMQLQVEPGEGPAFVAAATQLVNVLDLSKAQPGAAAVVRYIPADTSQVAIMNLLGPLSALVDARGQDAEMAHKLVLDSEIAQEELGVRGVVADATVVESQGSGIFLHGGAAEMTHLSLAVAPAGGPSFTAETTAAIATASALKVQPGAAVTVRYDPQRPTHVVIAKLSG